MRRSVHLLLIAIQLNPGAVDPHRTGAPSQTFPAFITQAVSVPLVQSPLIPLKHTTQATRLKMLESQAQEPLREVSRRARFDRVFFKGGRPTSLLWQLERYFDFIEATIKGQSNAPISMEFHPGGACNLNCEFCLYGEHRPANHHLSLQPSEVLKWIDDIEAYNAKAQHPLVEVKFGGIFSEPLTAGAKVATLAGMRHAIAKGFWVGLTTNGVQLDEEAQNILVDTHGKSGSYVNISLDAGFPQTYHALKLAHSPLSAGALAFHRVIQHTGDLVRKRDAHHAPLGIHLSYVLQEKNMSTEELEAVVRTALDLQVDSIRFRFPSRKAEGAPQLGTLESAYKVLRQLQQQHVHSRTQIVLLSSEEEAAESLTLLIDGTLQDKNYARCRAPFMRMTVGPDGNCYLCEHRTYPGGVSYGHIRDGFEAVMQSAERAEAISAVRPQQDSRCQFCALHNHYTNELFDVLAREYAQDPKLFDWLREEYDYFGHRRPNYTEYLQRVRAIQQIVLAYAPESRYPETLRQLAEFLDRALKSPSQFDEMRVYAAYRAKRPELPEILPHEIVAPMTQLVRYGRPPATAPNAYKGFTAGSPFDENEFMASVFDDEEFRIALQLLSMGPGDYRPRPVQENAAIRGLLGEEFRRAFSDRLRPGASPEAFDRYLEALTEETLSLYQSLVELSYENYPAAVKDGIAMVLPYVAAARVDDLFLRHRSAAEADSLFEPTDVKADTRFHRKLFADTLLRVLSNQVRVLDTGPYAFKPRQLFICLEIFYQRLLDFARVSGLGSHFQPLILLRDGEPLAYPFLGLFDACPREPLLIHLNRLCGMPAADLAEFQSRGFSKASLYSQRLFARNTPLQRALQGDPVAGIPPLTEKAGMEAKRIAGDWYWQRRKTSPSVSSGDALRQYGWDVEKLFHAILLRDLLAMMRNDSALREALQSVASSVVPGPLLESGATSIVMDSGIKGSLAGVVASLINAAQLTISDEADPIDVVVQAISSPERLGALSLPSRIFLYGTDAILYPVIPNAGFFRYSYGGSNTFLEFVPRFLEFNGLAADGTARTRLSGEFQRDQAARLGGHLAYLSQHSQRIQDASSTEDVIRLLATSMASETSPLELLVDLDNVVLKPMGYLGSETWFRDSIALIPDWQSQDRSRVFEALKQHERRLTDRRSYERLLDVRELKRRLKEIAPGCPVRLIGLTSRKADQAADTEKALRDLDVRDAFDALSFATEPGDSKWSRFQSLPMASNARVVLIDDAIHNLIPFLESAQVTPIVYRQAQDNDRDRPGHAYLTHPAASRGDFASVELFLNAVFHPIMPLTAKDLHDLQTTHSSPEEIPQLFLRLAMAALPVLSSEQLVRVEELWTEAFGGSFAQALGTANPEILRDRLNRVETAFHRHEAIMTHSGLRLQRVLENAVLEYVFEQERGRTVPDYVRLLINLLSPLMTATQIQDLFPEGAVFDQPFQWIALGQDRFEFHYAGEFYLYVYSPVPSRRLWLKARTIQELHILEIQHRLALARVAEQGVNAVTVHPTSYCDVGCDICLYHSKPDHGRKDPTRYLPPERVDRSIEVINAFDPLGSARIGGGGEPYQEFETVLAVLSRSKAKKLKSLTSGNWAVTPEAADAYFDQIDQALQSRATPAALEFNVSVDRYHDIKMKNRHPDYISYLLAAFVRAKDAGKLANVDFHVRAMSTSGTRPDEDSVIAQMLSGIQDWQEEASGPKERMIRAGKDHQIPIQISYAKMLHPNRAAALEYVDAMGQNLRKSRLDRLFINSDGTVALGGYYPALPLGKLGEQPAEEFRRMAETDPVALLIQRRGLACLIGLVREFNPMLLMSPPASGAPMETVTHLLEDPGTRYYVYLRALQELSKDGVLPQSLVTPMGADPLISPKELASRCRQSSESYLTLDVARRRNWGVQPSESRMAIDDTLRFGHLWWDVGGDPGRAWLRKRAQEIQSIRPLEEFVRQRLQAKWGIEADIKSIVVVGSYIANLSPVVPPHDVDLAVIIRNKGVREFVPEQPFIFGSMLRNAPGEHSPGIINIWIISEEYLHPGTSHAIDLDIAYNSQSGLVLLGTKPQEWPVPVLERLKHAYYFSNMILKMAADRMLDKLQKRTIDALSTLEQLRQIAWADPSDLQRSSNIAPVDKEGLSVVRDILQATLQDFIPYNPGADWARLGTSEWEVPDSPEGPMVRTLLDQEIRRRLVEQMSTLRPVVLDGIRQLSRAQAKAMEGQPVQNTRQWSIEMFKANTVSRSLEDHLKLATRQPLDYFVAVGLAATTRYPSVLETLYRQIKEAGALSPDQVRQLMRLIARNPSLSPALAQRMRLESPEDEALRKALNENSGLSLEELGGTLSAGSDLLMADSRSENETYLGKVPEMVQEVVQSLSELPLEARRLLMEKGEAIYQRLFMDYTGPLKPNNPELFRYQLGRWVLGLVEYALFSRHTTGAALYEHLPEEQVKPWIGRMAQGMMQSPQRLREAA